MNSTEFVSPNTAPRAGLWRNCYRCGRELQTAVLSPVCASCRQTSLPGRLSLRERQIVERVLESKSNKEIAFELHLATGTVKEYLQRIYRKLEVRGRTELAICALHKIRTGYFPNQDPRA